jgi:uncharacterized protein involved in exopolysaccharide biosynthesis
VTTTPSKTSRTAAAKNMTKRAAAPAGQATDDNVETETDLRDLFLMIWRGKWAIALFAIIGIGFAVQYVRNFAPYFEASMIIRPNTDNSLPETLGGGNNNTIQALAGIGGGQTKLIDQFRIVYKTRIVAERLQKKHDLLPILYGGYDAQAGRWDRPSGWQFELKERIKQWLGVSGWAPPTIDEIRNYVENEIKIEPESGTDMMVLTYRKDDPQFAKWFLEMVFEEADALLKERELLRTSAKLDYLRRRIQETTILDHRQALVQLLSNEEKRMMLLSSDLPYAVQVVQPLSVPDKAFRPSIARTALAGAAAGIALGLLLVLVFNFFWAIFRQPGQVPPAATR